MDIERFSEMYINRMYMKNNIDPTTVPQQEKDIRINLATALFEGITENDVINIMAFYECNSKSYHTRHVICDDGSELHTASGLDQFHYREYRFDDCGRYKCIEICPYNAFISYTYYNISADLDRVTGPAVMEYTHDMNLMGVSYFIGGAEYTKEEFERYENRFSLAWKDWTVKK